MDIDKVVLKTCVAETFLLDLSVWTTEQKRNRQQYRLLSQEIISNTYEQYGKPGEYI